MRYLEVVVLNKTVNKNVPLGHLNWVNYWERKKLRKSSNCEILLCDERSTEVLRVKKKSFHCREFIIPVCETCSKMNSGTEITVWESDLVIVAIK